MSASRLAVVARWAALLLLVGCRPPLQVTLASAQEVLPAPAFRVEDPENPERPLYNTVQVLDAQGTLYWHLRAEPFGDMNSVSQLTYGQVPTAFEEVEAARALEAGGRYSIFVVGKNRGSLQFEVDEGGHVQAVAP